MRLSTLEPLRSERLIDHLIVQFFAAPATDGRVERRLMMEMLHQDRVSGSPPSPFLLIAVKRDDPSDRATARRDHIASPVLHAA